MIDYLYSIFTKTDETPFLCYEIKAPNGKVSYILGTMHYFFNIPPELVEKMNNGSITHLMVENAPSAKKGKLSFALNDRIVLMAEKKQIPITSLDRQTPNFPYDIKNLMYFLAPEMKVIIHQDLKKEALLYLKQDSTILNQKVSEYAKKYFLASERTERWIPDMVNSLDQGGSINCPRAWSFAW